MTSSQTRVRSPRTWTNLDWKCEKNSKNIGHTAQYDVCVSLEKSFSRRDLLHKIVLQEKVSYVFGGWFRRKNMYRVCLPDALCFYSRCSSYVMNKHFFTAHTSSYPVFIESVCLKKAYHPIYSTWVIKTPQWMQSLGGGIVVVWNVRANDIDVSWSAQKVLKELKNDGIAGDPCWYEWVEGESITRWRTSNGSWKTSSDDTAGTCTMKSCSEREGERSISVITTEARDRHVYVEVSVSVVRGRGRGSTQERTSYHQRLDAHTTLRFESGLLRNISTELYRVLGLILDIENKMTGLHKIWGQKLGHKLS